MSITRTRSTTRTTNHPNRNKRTVSPSRTPKPADITHQREVAGLSVADAATLVHTTPRAWRQWEAAEDDAQHRRMHPAFFELFQIKTDQVSVPKFNKQRTAEK